MFLLSDSLGIDGCRRQLGVPQPSLHEVEWDPCVHCGNTEAMSKPFWARLHAMDAGCLHHCLDVSPRGHRTPGP